MPEQPLRAPQPSADASAASPAGAAQPSAQQSGIQAQPVTSAADAQTAQTATRATAAQATMTTAVQVAMTTASSAQVPAHRAAPHAPGIQAALTRVAPGQMDRQAVTHTQSDEAADIDQQQAPVTSGQTAAASLSGRVAAADVGPAVMVSQVCHTALATLVQNTELDSMQSLPWSG